MFNMKSKLLFLISILLLTGCLGNDADDTAEDKEKYNIIDKKAELVEQKVTDANTEFSFKIFKEMMKEDKENLFISPFSISTAMSMLYNGADTDTKLKMAETLEFNDFDIGYLNENYKNLIESLENVDDKLNVSISNSIWSADRFSPKKEFLDVNKEYYLSEIYSRDFSNPAVKDEINKWISDSTKGKIDKMIEQIDPSTVMFIINAVYFKGDWTVKFDEKKTVKGNFTSKNGEIKSIDMMNNTSDTYGYFENEDVKGVRLGYGRDKVAFYMFMDKKSENADKMIINMTGNTLNQYIKQFYKKEVNVTMPKFKIEEEKKELNDVFKNMGLEIIFSGNADFTKISDGICVNKIEHKAVIEVNEQGSEAAGVTVIDIKETAANKEEFTANKPFLFMIRDDRSGKILFMGKLDNI